MFPYEDNIEVPNRPAHFRNAVLIVAARLANACDCWDQLIKTKSVYSNSDNHPDLQMDLGLRCLHVRL